MIRRFFRWYLAYFHLSPRAVCELSTDDRDYHDHTDGTVTQPMHFYTYTCRRCGRKFMI